MEAQNEWNKVIDIISLQQFLQVINRDADGNPIKISNPFTSFNSTRIAENENDFEEIYNRELNRFICTDLNTSTSIKEDLNDLINKYKKTDYSNDQTNKALDVARSFITFLDIKTTTKISKTFYKNQHSTMFTNDGFELFEYILNNHITEKRGRINDISFYYWKMREDKLIIQRPFPFVKWFVELYSVEDFQIKTLATVHNPDRLKHYSNSLDWFKLQKQ